MKIRKKILNIEDELSFFNFDIFILYIQFNFYDTYIIHLH